MINLHPLLAAALLQNELDGNRAAAYRFSDPDGVHNGKSGWSFGCSQFDLGVNPLARQCLSEAGFSPEEVAGLVKQEVGPSTMRALNARLRTPAVMAVIDAYDDRQLTEIIDHVHQVVTSANLIPADIEAFIHLCDYHNQYNIEFGGKCVRHLQRLGRHITSADVRDYKLTTAWGVKRPDDVDRRWNNIHAICAGR